MSLSASQASATQKLLEHIRSTPQKDDASASFAPPLQIPPAAPLRPLFGKERSVVGIDVGKGRICLVQRRAGSTPILEAIQSFSIPETMDWETPGLADRIREALSAFLPHGGRDADIWVRLPDGQDELRHYRIPKVSPKDRDAIAKMAAIREKTFDEAENIFDYRVDAEVLDKGVPRLPVTAMIANKGAVNTVRHTLAAAGVSPAGITSGNIYAQNLFASGWLSSPWEHFAFADIGEDSTRIEIFSGTNITLSRTIKTGLRSLVTALQESYGGRSKKTPPPPVVPPMPRHLPMEALGGELAGPHSERQQAVSSFTSPSDPFPLILQPESLPLELSPMIWAWLRHLSRLPCPQRPYPPSPKKFRTMKFPMKKACTCSAKTGAARPKKRNACFCAFPSLSEGWPGSWNAPPTTSATLWGCRTFRASLCSPPAAAWRLR